MRATLDTNVFVSAFNFGGIPEQVLDLNTDERFVLCLSSLPRASDWKPVAGSAIFPYAERMNEGKEYHPVAPLDWSQCPIVESIPGKVSGAWVLKDTRMPVQIIFDNLAAGMDVEEVMDQFSVTRDQINALMEFITHTLDKAPSFEPTEP